MICVFCQIISKEIPVDIIYEDKRLVVFNDKRPRAPVHQLIVPKKHIPTLNDVTDHENDTQLLGYLLQTARFLAKEAGIAESGYRTVFNCNKDGGQEIFHLHLHLLGGQILSWPPG